MRLLNRIEELEKELLELKELAKQEQGFPQLGDEYWYIDNDGEVMEMECRLMGFDKGRLLIDNVFRTKEEAEFAVEKLKVEAELRKFSVPIFKGCYYIYMKTEDGMLGFGVNGHYKSQGTIYFESEEKAQQAIKSVGEERIKKYLFGLED